MSKEFLTKPKDAMAFIPAPAECGPAREIICEHCGKDLGWHQCVEGDARDQRIKAMLEECLGSLKIACRSIPTYHTRVEMESQAVALAKFIEREFQP